MVQSMKTSLPEEQSIAGIYARSCEMDSNILSPRGLRRQENDVAEYRDACRPDNERCAAVHLGGDPDCRPDGYAGQSVGWDG